MRHKVDHRKLGRTHAHRKAMLANMVTSLFDKERIKTTDAKAKEARRKAERLITRAKKGYSAYQDFQSLAGEGKADEAKQMQAVALAHWRQAGRTIRKQSVLKKLFDVIAPQFLEREGGYTRILHLQCRPGDNAREVYLELVGVSEKRAEIATTETKGKKGKKADAKAEEVAAEEKPARKKAKGKKDKAEASGEKAEAKTDDTAEEEAPAEEPKKAAEETAGDATEEKSE